MSESFGAQLRQRRDAQGIALESVANETKIKLSLLEALERDDVSHWPGGLFRRSFIRAYAQAIGIDPDRTVREFLAAHFDPAFGVDTSNCSESNGNGHATGFVAKGAPPTRLHEMMDLVMQSLSRRRQSPPVNFLAGDAPPSRPAEVTPALQSAAVIDSAPKAAPPPAPDLQALADLCTAMGRVECADEFQPLLADAARILKIRGLIVWVWDDFAAELRPVLAHGYSDRVLARFPALTLDSTNPTAEACRSGQTTTTDEALVVPLMTSAGCVGSLALELERDAACAPETTFLRPMATVVAAMLAQLVGGQAVGASREIHEFRSRESA